MIILSGVLVVVAIGLLVVGIVAGNTESAQIGGLDALTLIYISIAVSVVSLLCLVIGAFLRRHELFGPVTGAAARPKRPKQRDHKGKRDATVVATAIEPAAGDFDDDLPGLHSQPVDVPADALVHVVRGRKRYHLDSCRQLAGRVKEELTYSEAIEEGFSPCTACLPDTALAARAAASGPQQTGTERDGKRQIEQARSAAEQSTRRFGVSASYAGSTDADDLPSFSEPEGHDSSAGGLPSAWGTPGSAPGAGSGSGIRRTTPSAWRQPPSYEPSGEWDSQSEAYPDVPLEFEPELDPEIDAETTRTDIPRPAEPVEGRSVFERTRPEPEPAEPAAERRERPAEDVEEIGDGDVTGAAGTRAEPPELLDDADDLPDLDTLSEDSDFDFHFDFEAERARMAAADAARAAETRQAGGTESPAPDDEADGDDVHADDAATGSTDESVVGSPYTDDVAQSDAYTGAADDEVTADFGTAAETVEPRPEPADHDENPADEAVDEPVDEPAGVAADTSGGPMVRILSGTKRYHRASCALIEDIGDDADDLESLFRSEAKSRGCTPCLVCQPDKEHTDD